MPRFLMLLVLSSAFANARTQVTPDVDGYVTQVMSASDFAVDGVRVICSAKTGFRSNGGGSKSAPWANGPFLGQPLQIFGGRDHKTHALRAREIWLPPDLVNNIKSSGVIDQIAPADTSSTPKKILVRADGYPILIESETRSTFTPPLSSLTDIGTNVWIDYKGEQPADGLVVAKQIHFSQNRIDAGEEKLRKKSEYDTANVDPKKQQGKADRLLLGTDVKRIPPYADTAKQSRIEKVGASLIPAYQRGLPVTNATRVDFRFQLIDVKGNEAYSFPSGIVLVPVRVLDQMENDDQLAAVLADAMASALEKRDYREQPTKRAVTAGGIGALAGGSFVPGLGLADLGGAFVLLNMQQHDQERSARVSLAMMHDAGYDIDQAPIAWWRLAAKNNDLSASNLPARSRYLYQTLGKVWRGGQMSHIPSKP